MSTVARFVGLDVHKDSIAMAVAEEGREAARDLGSLAHDVPALRRRLQRLGPPEELLIGYEAGPTGYGLCRKLREQGYACEVLAPSRLPHRPADRVKTDRLDARRLALALRAGDLSTVVVPDVGTEALRDLSRTRDDAKRAERSTRHQLDKDLLRHDRRYPGRTLWTGLHMTWIAQQHFEQPAQEQALLEMRAAVIESTARVTRLSAAIAEHAPASAAPASCAALSGPSASRSRRAPPPEVQGRRRPGPDRGNLAGCYGPRPARRPPLDRGSPTTDLRTCGTQPAHIRLLTVATRPAVRRPLAPATTQGRSNPMT
ncbi:MAG TPA: transposase [Planctomycetota bacterium]|nr:transposase [Planctomycetota bacterium]